MHYSAVSDMLKIKIDWTYHIVYMIGLLEYCLCKQLTDHVDKLVIPMQRSDRISYNWPFNSVDNEISENNCTQRTNNLFFIFIAFWLWTTMSIAFLSWKKHNVVWISLKLILEIIKTSSCYRNTAHYNPNWNLVYIKNKGNGGGGLVYSIMKLNTEVDAQRWISFLLL